MEIAGINSFAPKLIRIGMIRAENALAPEQNYGLRLTTEYEFDLITGGKGAIRTGKHMDPAVYGMLFFRQPGTEADGWGGYHCGHLRFQLNREDASIAPQLPLKHALLLKNPEPILQEFRVLYNAFLDQDPALDFLTTKCLGTILYEFYRVSAPTEEKHTEKLSPALSHFIKETVAQFEQTPQQRYSLEELCESAHVSKYFFCRAFKAATGETVVGCLNRLRVRHAQRLLLESSLPVQEIQFACGYESSAQFFELFRRHTGYTPKQYRAAFSFRDS